MGKSGAECDIVLWCFALFCVCLNIRLGGGRECSASWLRYEIAAWVMGVSPVGSSAPVH